MDPIDVQKTPTAEFALTFDLGRICQGGDLPEGVDLASVSWSASSGLTIGSADRGPTVSGSMCTVWISEGTSGEDYILRGTPVTDATPAETLNDIVVRVRVR